MSNQAACSAGKPPIGPLAFLLVSSIALTACSWERSARISAGVSQPQFTFTNLGRFIGSHSEPVCATRVSVSEGNRKIWEVFVAIDSAETEPRCEMLGDIRYGEVPTGFSQSIAPEALRHDTPYALRFDNIGEYPNHGRRAFCLDDEWQAVDVRYRNGVPVACKD